MKNKIFVLIAGFLLLIPFSLPVSILIVDALNALASLGGKEVPQYILIANVVVTKAIYNIFLSSIFVYNFEMFSRQFLGRKPRIKKSAYSNEYDDEPFFWWTSICGVLLFIFVIVDVISIVKIF